VQSILTMRRTNLTVCCSCLAILACWQEERKLTSDTKSISAV
jgi:hypothetical protein